MLKRIHLMTLLVMISLVRPVSGQDSYNTTLIGHWANGPSHAVDVSGNIAYLGNEDTLEVLDTTDPANPLELGELVLTSKVTGIAVSDSSAYVACDSGLHIIDVSTPSSPQEVGYFGTVGQAKSVAFSDGYAYLAADSALYIIDISIPSSPQGIGTFNTGDWVQAISVSDGYAYVADGLSGLRVIDISIPSSPQEVGYFDTPDITMDVIVSDNYVYVTNGWTEPFTGTGSGGLSILDISTPSSPQEVGYHNLRGPYYLTVSGGYVYLASPRTPEVINGELFRIIDITTPSSPQEVGLFSIYDNATDIAVSGTFAYVTSGHGLYIIQNELLVVSNDEDPSLPESFELNQNYPNPFNPTTTIQYSLPEVSSVNITVFDIRGQEVTALLEVSKSSGNYEVQWNGLDQSGNAVSTGVYLARLQAGEYTQTIKMLYLR